MAANVLSSRRAVQMSVFVVRAFVKMRGLLTDSRALAKKLTDLETELKSRLDVHEAAIVEVLQRVMDILNPVPQPEPPQKEMGFHVKVAGKIRHKEASQTMSTIETEPLVCLRYFGHKVNPEAPAMGAYRKIQVQLKAGSSS